MKVIFSTPLKDARWPWPKMNVNEVAERALGNEIFMPNIGYVDIGDVEEWSAELGGAANSKKLWINSLVTPHACLAESKGDGDNQCFKKSVDLIKSYLRQYDSGQGLFDIAWKDEHAVSNRLFVLCAFVHHLVDVEEVSISQLELLYHAERHAQWLSYDEHYVKNNHGVMMDLSLAQYSVLIRDTDPKQADAYLQVALRRLGMMLNDTFDSQGCCSENSPSYHFVNYSLFLSIFSFLKEYAKGFDLGGWEETLEKAKAVGALLLRPDGTVPLIGDSESRPGTFFPNVDPELSKGVGYYPEAGLFVLSEDNVHFTFRAGGSKYSHRHIDDLSITLWLSGREFIVDAGLYNYDITDKMRRRFIYSESHSGIYLESQGHVRFKDFDKPSCMSRFISSCSKKSGFSVLAVHNLSKNCGVFREAVYRDKTLEINDSFTSDTSEKWRCQFLLHPDCQIEIDQKNKSALISNAGVVLGINFKANSNNYRVYIKEANYSPSFMDLNGTNMLVVEGDCPSLKLTSCFNPHSPSNSLISLS
jgi:hypothetical protein